MAVGIQSVKRASDWAHSVAERDADAAHAATYGAAQQPEGERDNMGAGDIYLGDVTVNPTPSPVRKLSNAAMIAVVLLGGGLGAVGTMLATRDTPDTPSVTVDTDTMSTLEVDRD